MALSDYYDEIDQALAKLSDALDLLEEISSEEIEMGKVDEFESLIEQIDDAAVKLEALVNGEEVPEEDQEQDVVDAEFRRVR